MAEFEARFDLPAGIEAPAMARRALQSVLCRWGFRDEHWAHLAMVIISELVTNAVQHGGGRLSMDVHAEGDVVVIGASDGSAVVPSARDPDDEGGRGLTLIETLSAGWGVQDRPGGKRVWVELVPHPRPPAL